MNARALCPKRAPAAPLSEEDKMTITAFQDNQKLIAGYQLCATTEGKSHDSIEIVMTSLKRFQGFLATYNSAVSLTNVTRQEIRAFVAYLQETRRFAYHPTIHGKEGSLSGHTVNCYLRSLRIFYSWLVSEEIIQTHPFDKVKIPKPPIKVIPAFTGSQIENLLRTVDTKTAIGYRNYAIMLTLLDTGIRLSELCSLKIEKLWLEDGMAKVLGKGNKERMIPIGKQLQHILWHYINRCRPEPTTIHYNSVFLTHVGRPLTTRHVQKIIAVCGRKAKLVGVRCSPHTFRHTAAISFLRNGGDLFSLQRILGHASLEMTRRYCELADTDVKKAHSLASPVDNLDFTSVRRVYRIHDPKPLPLAKGDYTSDNGRPVTKSDNGVHYQRLANPLDRIQARG
jgi:site-specific recombinase XerD